VKENMNASYFKCLAPAALAWCLCQFAASAAITYDWQFSTAANPASPEVGDPAALATIGDGSYVNNAQSLGFLVSSFWALGANGNVGLSLPSTAGQPLELILTVRQYVQSGFTAIYDGNIGYSVPSGSEQGSVTKVPVTSADGANGIWYDYTTDWQVSSSLNPETAIIFGSPNGTLINEIQVTVVPVPEPIAGVVCSAGFVIAAAVFHQRRHRGAGKQPGSGS
jgi:hypothetical protein